MTPSSIPTTTAAATSIAEQVRAAAASGRRMRIVGAGTWLDAGAPVAAEERLTSEGHSGIVQFVPGDLTITALAGTSLEEIMEVTARQNQCLTLDPYGSPRGSIGATIATASHGPLALSHGTPRDHLLGVEFVTGRGEIVRGGGRVTKNVAGFDLSRLVCGAWGTNGVITELTLRLRALPARDVTFAMAAPEGGQQLAEVLHAFRTAGLTPAALELVSGSLGSELLSGSGGSGALLIRFRGNASGVAAQQQRLRSLGSPVECDGSIWSHLLQRDERTAIVFRLSTRVSEQHSLFDYALGILTSFPGSWSCASVGRGIVRVVVPDSDGTAEHASVPGQGSNHGSALEPLAVMLRRRPPCRLLCEKLPASLWPVLAPPDELSDRLTTGVRDAFDPYRILNPGILGEDVVAAAETAA